MRRIAAALLAAGGVWLARGASAQPPADAAPDLEFLEYLGSWQADDDEWLAIREWEQDNPPVDADGTEEKDDGGTAPERSRNENDENR